MTNGNAAQAKVRMYRQGFGDCFLISLPVAGCGHFRVLIDCGVILGTPDATEKMQDVVRDIREETGGKVDLLVVTHEHWDHVSGFHQAREILEGITFERLWLPWTEDPADELAKKLRGESLELRAALTSAAAHMRFAGAPDVGAESLLELFGARTSTADIFDSLTKLVASPRYCRPSHAPVQFDGVDARFYVLGPPHDEKMIRRFSPSKTNPETFGAASMLLGNDDDRNAPFDRILQIPMAAARQMPFFLAHYFGEAASASEEQPEVNQDWRRIDAAHLEASSELALQLDSATNNTSLVLAIELADGRVLLFAADAQVGNWLSWQDLKWFVGGRQVTGPDLLNRTVLYKVGHHGSHNATLREKGLEQMTSLELAMVPVDSEVARRKGWTEIPLELLEHELEKATKGCVLRSDRPVPTALAQRVKEDPLFYEVTF